MAFEMPAAPEFIADLTARNADILSAREQAGLQAGRIVVAGCGTVGGSVVEPLVRLGLSDFVLSDPEVFDTTNLNRQMCNVTDIGRPKAEVLRDRILAINPLAIVTTFIEGFTVDNLGDALTGASVVFDGIDAFTSLWVKYLMHKYAAERRIPVIAGSDYGGKPTLYVFDYRRDPRPFYGKANEVDFRNNNHQRALRWLGIRNLPTDFLPIIGDRMTTGAPWPQITYCSLGMGATGSRAVIDLLCDRQLPPVIAVDIHRLMKSRTKRTLETLIRPRVIAETRRTLRKARQQVRSVAAEEEDNRIAMLAPVIEAVRLAPSVANSQPWRLVPTSADALRLDFDRTMLMRIENRYLGGLLQSLGCAYAAAEAVAELELVVQHDVAALADGHGVAKFRVQRIRDDYPRVAGALQLRHTNRSAFDTTPVDKNLLESFRRISSRRSIGLLIVDDAATMGSVAAELRADLTERLKERVEFEELLGSINLCSKTMKVGLKLRQGMPSATAIRLARRSAIAASFTRRFGLVRALGGQLLGNVDRCGALLLLTGAADGNGDVNAGRALMEIWLAATRAGVSVQPLSVTQIARERRSRVSAAFGLADVSQARVALRMGYARAAMQSPKLPLEGIVRSSEPDEVARTRPIASKAG